jgi:hypothetical protein
MKRKADYQTIAFTMLLSAACTVPLAAQSTAPAAEEGQDDEVIVLSPFEVTTEENEGYTAATTLAGNRLNTELRDIGSAVQVVTSQFLKDTGAVNNETLLQYTTSTEVGNVYGNFAGLGDGAQLNETSQFLNPNQNTRVRGLTSADNTRDYFTSDIPWDGYYVDRVDLQRGPNSILFGQGSPAGIINNGTKQAGFQNSGELEFRFDDSGSIRASLDVNRELIDDQLAVRIALLRDDQKFQQKPAFQLSKRAFGALRWEPAFLKKGSARTIVKMNFETGAIDSNRPRSLPPGDTITPWFYTGTVAGRFALSGEVAGARPLDPVTGQLVGTPVRYAQGDPRTYQNLNKFSTNPHIAMNDNFFRPDLPMGLVRPSINGGPYGGMINPTYNPWIGTFAASFGGPIGYFTDTNSATPSSPYWEQELNTNHGLSITGNNEVAFTGGVGFQFHRLIGIAPYSEFATLAQLPYAEFGVYKNNSLTDPTIFNFYDNLLDGPNKEEWQDFDVFNVSVAQTFFNEKLGLELTYNTEQYENGQLSLVTGNNQSIGVDINSHYSDGTKNGSGTYPNNIPFGDGTPNPNLGRPYIAQAGSGGNNSFTSDRESKRATAFFTHDFEREGQNSNFLTRLLGRHTVTGLWAEDERKTENRSWVRYAILDPEFRAFKKATGNFNTLGVSQVIYLGPSLLNASSAAGANLDRPRAVTTFPDGPNRLFDSHWKYSLNPADPDYLNPANLFVNNFAPGDVATNNWFQLVGPNRIGGTALVPFATGEPNYGNPHFEHQARNPDNYVGWVDMPLRITDSETSAANRDLLTTNASMARRLTSSKAVVWQGHLWDNALVGTYGIREDKAEAWTMSRNTNSNNPNDPDDSYPDNVPYRVGFGHLNLSPEVYKLPDEGTELTETSRSWSVVAHLNELPGIGGFMEKLPVRVSLFYNDSENFQPESGRRDILGRDLALPSGVTEDYGVLFESKDGKYSFKVNKYQTEALNANSNGLGGAWYIGGSQSWGGNWVNQYEYDFGFNNQASGAYMAHQVNNRPAGAPNPPGWTPRIQAGNREWDAGNSLYNFGTGGAYATQAEAAAYESVVIAEWREWQAHVAEAYPGFYEAWGLDLATPLTAGATNGITDSLPNGFALTEDSVSKGWEFEFSAQPTRNWRFSVNAAKTNATRANIGGPVLAEWINDFQQFLTGPGGDLRIWWGGAGNDTSRLLWYRTVGSEWAQRALQEGTNVPELREWRVNAITNYDFTEGRLKGFNVGGGIRWQDEIVNGYRPVPGATPQQLSFDIDNPYMGPSETNLDVWIGYQRRIADKVDWRIQLNVRNITQSDELIPITTQPDGTPAAYRIAPPRTWTVTNTFRF